MSLITLDTPVTTIFSSQPKRVTWERTWAYAGGPFALHGWPICNIHTDPEYANSVGLSEPNVTGTQTQGYVIALLIDIFGEQWLTHGKLSDVKFIRLISINETIQIHAQVVSKEHDHTGVKYTLDIKCLKQDGEIALVGQAVGWIVQETPENTIIAGDKS